MLNIIFFVLSIIVIPTLQCGITTHNVIANRAVYWYLQSEFPEYQTIIQTNLEYFQNGAAFPDWGFSCVLDHEIPSIRAASEFSHWFTFQKAIINIIHKKYTKPWNQEAQQLIAFLLGVTAHSIADIIWHDLGKAEATEQGFIQAMANSNYNAQGSMYTWPEHLEADTGGEFLCAYETDLSFLKSYWEFPIDTLVEVFHQFNFTEVDETVLLVCNAELYLEVQAIKTLPTEYVLPYFANNSTFLLDHTQDWWLGGLNDLAMWVSYCWTDTIMMLENQTFTQRCFVSASQKSPEFKSNSLQHTKQKIKELNKYQFTSKQKNMFDCIDYNNQDILTITTNITYAELGKSITHGDFNADGYDDIAVSMIGYNKRRGAVGILYGNKTHLLNYDIKSLQLIEYNNGQPNSRFGDAIISLDINLDGYDDLVVGIPGTDAFTFGYKGKLNVYLGGPTGIINQAEILWSSNESYTNLGSNLNKGDVNSDGFDDLIVGMPYMKNFNSSVEAGSVGIILSDPVTLENPSINMINSNYFWSWFGYQNRVMNYYNQTFLLVGQPMLSNGKDNVGQLNCYDQNLKLIWKITGDEKNGQFGLNFGVDKHYVYISAPTAGIDQSGIVYKVSIDEIFSMNKSDMDIDELKYDIYVGSGMLSRFGLSIHIKNKLYISEPYDDFESGRVHVYDNDNHVCYFTKNYNSQFGKIIDVLDFNGDGLDDMLVSLPRDSTLSEIGGSVVLIFG